MSRISKVFCLVLFLMIIQMTGFSQQVIIAARDELSFNVGVNIPIGEKSVGAIPTVLANMQPGMGLNLNYTTTLFKNLQLGAWLGSAKFSGWSSAIQSKLYSGSSMKFLSIGPVIGYSTTQRRMSRSKFGFGVWALPGISKVKLETSEDSGINGDSNKESLTLESTRFTLGLNAGVSYVFTSSLGVRLLAGYRYTASDSKVMKDPSYATMSIGAGVFYRIHLDKRFKFSQP